MLLDMEPGLLGLNVTVPHKQAILPFLDELDPVAAAIGAVNTIAILREGVNGEGKGTIDAGAGTGGSKVVLKGYNTDVIGFRESLEPLLEADPEGALVLGTGGSSLAVCYALEQLGVPYLRVSRNPGENRITYEEVDAACLAGHRLLINTTPLGMFPEVDACPPIDYEELGPEHLLFDLVYNPALTLFLRKGKEQGCRVSNGHNMLICQAEASWAIWDAIHRDERRN